MENLDSYAGFDGFPDLPIPSTTLIELKCSYAEKFIPKDFWEMLILIDYVNK